MFPEFDPSDAPAHWGHTQAYAWAAGANLVLDLVISDEECTPELREKLKQYVQTNRWPIT